MSEQYEVRVAAGSLRSPSPEALGLGLSGVRVRATGTFDTETWQSHGIAYEVDIESRASEDELAALLQRVDDVAEIPRAMRAGAPVARRARL